MLLIDWMDAMQVFSVARVGMMARRKVHPVRVAEKRWPTFLIGGECEFLELLCYWVMLDMPRMMVSAAGPSSTMNMLGKMKRTSGKMILTVVLAAFSSAS